MPAPTSSPKRRLPAAAPAILLCCLACAQPAQTQTQPQPSLAALRQGFAQPPPQARLRCYWWWLNGHTDKPTITHDLEEMKAKGFGGALLVDADGSGQGGNRQVTPGPTFASPAWTRLYLHALAEADRLGLEITLNITSGWNLGGPGVTPAQSSKLLTWTRTPVAGGRQVHLQLAPPPSKNNFYRQIAVLAYPLHNPATAAQPHGLPGLPQRSAAVETGFSMPPSTWMLSPSGTPGTPANVTPPPPLAADAQPSEVLDLSSHLAADGALTWNAPPGPWELLRIGYTDSDARVSTSSGDWQGRAIDYLSRDAFDSYWDRVVEPLLHAARPFHSLRFLATDSWELGGTDWTQTFAAEFQRRRGYDPVPWLPVVAGRILGSPDQSARFLTDLRRTVADLVTANHYDRFAERAAQHGLGVQAESGGPHGAPIDALETFRRSAIPQTEFWSQNPHRSSDLQRFFPKEAASAANIYGRPLAAAEGETSIDEQWRESLATDLKPSFDMAITEGMNRLVWHEFTSSPPDTGLPGQEYFAGTHLNPKVTWWNASGAFLDYLNRVQFLMQQGTPVDDLLYFYGDNVPNFVRLKADDPAHVLPGYDYDVTGQDALLRTIRIQGATLLGPGGVRWRALALPSTQRLSQPALDLVQRYLRGGGTVLGLPPTSPPGSLSPARQARFDAQVKSLWDGCAPNAPHAVGQGRLYCTANARAVLAALQIPPDFTYTTAEGQTDPKPYASSLTGIDYIHRRTATTDIYFLRNAANSPAGIAATFRAQAARVELWDPVTGQVATLSATSSPAPGQTRIPLRLPPFGSIFVVFTREPTPAAPPLPPSQTVTQPITTLHPWTLTFQPGRGAPTTPQTLDGWTSWTQSADPGIRYFSGAATYKATVQAPTASPGQPVYLQLDGLHEIARIRLNGADAGTIWAMPYRLRVDPLLRPGANDLEIQVTNLWPNRIIGDLQPNAAQHITSTNITAYNPTSPLLPSGLLTPPHWELIQPTTPNP